VQPRTRPAPQSTRLLDQVRERARYLHYSPRTEKAYVYWVRYFIRWNGMKHPRDMGAADIQAFLTMLASERHVASSTHNQALSAILFLYREVMGIDVPWLQDLNRPAHKRRIPAVLSPEEVARLLQSMEGEIQLVARLLYGTGMRLMEALRLRVKDVDFDREVIVVREAKGNKDRVVMLPRSVQADLRAQLAAARIQWELDHRRGFAGVEVPHALERKYPKVGQTWGWFGASSAGAARAQRRQHHDDLHARAQDGCRRHPEPARCDLHGMTAGEG
jgi:integron integrase